MRDMIEAFIVGWESVAKSLPDAAMVSHHCARAHMASEKWQSGTPVGKSMSALRTAFVDSGFANRCREYIKDRIKAGTLPKNSMDYWLSAPEMFARVFERHVQESLKRSGRDNTYLVGLRKDGHPLWPTAEESEKIRPAMESLLAAVKSQHFTKER